MNGDGMRQVRYGRHVGHVCHRHGGHGHGSVTAARRTRRGTVHQEQADEDGAHGEQPGRLRPAVCPGAVRHGDDDTPARYPRRAYRRASARRTPYQAAPATSTPAPMPTETTGSEKASATQPTRPATGTMRGGRPSCGVSVHAEALAIA